MSNGEKWNIFMPQTHDGIFRLFNMMFLAIFNGTEITKDKVYDYKHETAQPAINLKYGAEPQRDIMNRPGFLHFKVEIR